MSNNSDTVRDTRKVSINHDYETGVYLSDSVNKTCVKRPLAEKARWRHIRLAIKPNILIKPRYPGNHAPQIKSYYGTLLGSHGLSFRIRHEKLPEAPPSGEFTMTSYPPWNKTSLSRKPCIPDNKLLWNTIRKSWSLFQKPSYKITWSAPWRRNHDDVISGLQKTSASLFRKPCIADKKLLLITITKSWSLSNFHKKQQILILKNLSFYKDC